jgi:tetratricopeptide (TPR) repeat protein
VYLQAGFFDRAEKWFTRALELNPDNQGARNNLEGMKKQGYALTGTNEDTAKSSAEAVVALMRQGNLAGADSVMTLSRERWKDPATGKIPAPLQFVEATLRFQQGRCADAIVAYEELNPVMSASEVFLNNLAAAYAECNRLEDAVKTWSQALRLNPGNEVIADQLRRARAEMEQRQAAEDSLR